MKDSRLGEVIFPSSFLNNGCQTWPAATVRGHHWDFGHVGPGFWKLANQKVEDENYRILGVSYPELEELDFIKLTTKVSGLTESDGITIALKELPKSVTRKLLTLDEALQTLLYSETFTSQWNSTCSEEKTEFYRLVQNSLSAVSEKRHIAKVHRVVRNWVWSLCCGLSEKKPAHIEWWHNISANIEPRILFTKAATMHNGKNYIMQGRNTQATERFLALLKTDADKQLWAELSTKAILSGKSQRLTP